MGGMNMQSTAPIMQVAEILPLNNYFRKLLSKMIAIIGNKEMYSPRSISNHLIKEEKGMSQTFQSH